MSLDKKNQEKNVFNVQDSQYIFPYHHIPYLDENGSISRVRMMDWGFDYLACKFNVIKTVNEFKPKSLLEVGCGDGAIIGSLDSNIKKKVGVDLSERAIGFAKAFHPDVDFYCDDVDNIKEKFDMILLVEVLEHIPNDEVNNFIHKVVERLNENGVLYISVPSVNLPLYKKHYRHYSKESLSDFIIKADLNVIIDECKFFRTPVSFENFYKRLTCNRFFIGDFIFLRNHLWHKIINSLDVDCPKTGQHVVAILKKQL